MGMNKKSDKQFISKPFLTRTMPTRDEALAQIRPEIPSISPELAENSAEQFQNETLRPILKWQNDLLVQIYKQSLEKKKVNMKQLSVQQQEVYISQSLEKDHQLRNLMLGLIMGYFTLTEYEVFKSEEKELKKRTLKMIVQRLQSQLTAFC